MARILKGENRDKRYAGKWLVDYRDTTGKRHLPGFDSTGEAEDFFAKVALPAARSQRALHAAPKTTLQACFDRWVAIAKGNVKQRSLDIYATMWRLHCSEVGPLEARLMTRQRGEALLLRL